MPFNTSMPLLYINKEAFEKAGLDPSKPPTTLDEIMTDAQKIKSTPGETVQYGFGATLYGWYVEQWNADRQPDHLRQQQRSHRQGQHRRTWRPRTTSSCCGGGNR